MGALTPLFILHGWTYDTDKWQPFMDGLHKAGLNARMLHVPGLTAPLAVAWEPENYVSWLDTIIRTTGGKAVLLGHSNGGRLCLWYALAHPERVDRLILIDSAGVPRRDILTRLKRAGFGAVARTGKRITSSPVLRDLLYRIAGVRDYNTSSPVMKRTMTNLIAADIKLPLEKIAVPVTVIWGKYDTITPLTDGKEIARRIPHATLTVVPEARHAPQFTDPERLVQMVVNAVSV